MAFNPQLYYEHYYRVGQPREVELVPDANEWDHDGLVWLWGCPAWGIDAELVLEVI
jgi:hypothetical protein